MFEYDVNLFRSNYVITGFTNTIAYNLPSDF